jgi:hypothetical protein
MAKEACGWPAATAHVPRRRAAEARRRPSTAAGRRRRPEDEEEPEELGNRSGRCARAGTVIRSEVRPKASTGTTGSSRGAGFVDVDEEMG